MDTIATRGSIIDGLREKCIEIWESTPDTFPILNRRFSANEHAANEVRINAFIDDAIRLIKGFKGNGSDDSVKWGSSLKRLIYDCGVDIIGLGRDNMDLLLNGGFCDVTSEFISQARGFDAAFKFDDILQSLRNVWIMNCLQKLMDFGISLTPSILAYSMLYPYTDNFIDTNRISTAKKNDTNLKLRKRLSGEPVAAESSLEHKLFKLVEMIEAQYERSKYPMVYQSLIGIHDAQVRSMRQDSSADLISEDILDISAEKGGCSVWADGCLIKGHLSETEAGFIFCFGFLLQLVDDLQDIETDKSNGHKTLFSVNADIDKIQSYTNRLINFVIGIMDNDNCFMSNGAGLIKDLIKMSIVLLIMGAVATNSMMYDRNYIAALQEYSPISFRCFRNSYKKVGREYGKLKLKFSVKSLEIPMAKAFASGRL